MRMQQIEVRFRVTRDVHDVPFAAKHGRDDSPVQLPAEQTNTASECLRSDQTVSGVSQAGR